MRRRRGAPAPTADPLETILRLAVLLSAGASAATAWAHLAETGDPVLHTAAAAARRGADVGETLRAAGESWRDVAAVWTVAAETGAPLADTLRTVAASLRDAAEVAADVDVALAEPVATARLLGWMPLVGLPMGMAMGVDPARTLSEPAGAACVCGGVLLSITARAWTSRLSRTARRSLPTPGLRAELWAVALSSGASTDRARHLVSDATADRAQDDSDVDGTVALAVRTGVPAAELLRGDAWIARHRARTVGRTAAARLSTRLLLPLGICTLPAFLLLAVVPIMLGLLRASALP
ncbi:type II secretion system F family protein [Microbacterium sp. NPDC090007]|uniref:type II secretion system F family protein n=1 Tax=Microbacterium sp. NPDC090007 TaxID=3364204 RepID=UPI00382912C3